MLELGTGIAVAGVSISAAAVAITAIKTKNTNTPNGNGNGQFSQKLCEEKHKNLDKRFEGLENWMREIKADVKTLIEQHMKED